MKRFFSCLSVLAMALFSQKVSALQCWKCSSDIDRTCADPFNETAINSRRSGNFYDQQNVNQGQGQNYNPQFNSQYNPNFNPNIREQTPTVEYCNDNEATLKRMKNVCLKKTIRGSGSSGYVNIVRRCAMVDINQEVGTCHDPQSRGLNLEFCEYCDTDRCNSAFGIKANLLLATLLSFGLVLFIRQ